MKSLLKKLILWLIKNWLPGYHIAKNPPRGRKNAKANDEK